MSATRDAAMKALGGPVTDLYSLGKEQFKATLSKWKTQKHIEALYKKIQTVQKVKTIWQVDKEINIKSFYYPSKLLIEKKRTTIEFIDQIHTNSNVLIQGTVGQGKSTFLRYLCIQELRWGKRIPIFLELRKLRKGTSFKQHLIDGLDKLGISVDEKLLDFLAVSGKLILLLDGFDEIDPSTAIDVIGEIEDFTQKYPPTRIVITSRPDSGIQRSAYFRIYLLAPLDKSEIIPLVEKLVSDKDDLERVKEALKRNAGDIVSLLTTPLMVTLLVLSFRGEKRIPQQFSQFYENLFQTLFFRHDGAKPGFNRKRKCKINEKEMQATFEALCFLSKKQNLYTLSHDQIYKVAQEAAKVRQIDVDASNFISDVCKITCLVIEESGIYHFIHKSVQEYHAASFIKDCPDEAAHNFYKSIRDKKLWNIWFQELNFLEQIDKFRYLECIYIPEAKNILKSLQIDAEDPNSGIVPNSIRSFLKGVIATAHSANHLGVSAKEVDFPQYSSVKGVVISNLLNTITQFPSPATSLPQIYAYARANGTHKNDEVYEISFDAVVNHLQASNLCHRIVGEALTKFRADYISRTDYLNNEKELKRLLTF